MRRISRLIPPFLAVLCSFTVLGCSRGPVIAPVEGTVLINGKPAERILVEFVPDVKGPRSRGETNNQGRFILTTDDNRPGAVVGPHRVALRDAGVLGDKFLGRAGENVDMTQGRKSRLTDDFADPLKTPVRKEVTNGPNNIEVSVNFK